MTGNDPRQMGGSPGSGNDDLEASFVRLTRIVGGIVRCPMGGQDADFISNLKLLTDFGRFLHCVKV